MIEGEQLAEIPIVDEPDVEDENLEINLEWSELFNTLAMIAEGKDDDCDAIAFEGDIENLNNGSPYKLCIDVPFIDDDSRPRVITLDIYQGGIHTQRAIALAEWNGNNNNSVNVSNESIDDNAEYFDTKSLVNHAMFLITTAVTDTGIFPIPQEYEDNIH